MVISKNQIRKLGKRIRDAKCDREKCDIEDIKMLQTFRLDHKESLIYVFDVVSKVSKKIHSGRMSAFRLKKIDTILSKLERSGKQKEGKIELDRMWDVAGCRVILHSENAIYNVVELLQNEFEIKRFKDHINEPSADGYRGYHLYVKPKNIENAKIVEIQLRTIYQHLWATLVEVIDVVYDLKIKEGDDSIPELNEFLKIYSNWENASLEEKKRSFLIEKKHNLYSKLSEVFTENVLELRSDWIKESEYGENEPFLLFSVDQNTKKANFRTFKNIDEAEEHYLNDFMQQDGDFMVARISVKYFVQIAFVYANYVLSNHRFLDFWLYDTLNLLKDKEIDTDFVLEEIKPQIKLYSEEVERLLNDEGDIINFFEKQPKNEQTKDQIKKWEEERLSDITTRRKDLNEIKAEIEKHEKYKIEEREEQILKILGYIFIIGLIVEIINWIINNSKKR